MLAELETALGRSCRSTSQWYARQRAGTAPDDAVDVRAVACTDPRRAHRGGHRGRRRRRARPRGDGPPCGCAGGSTGWSATREGRLVVVDVKTGKSPVSKDDAQRHAQLAMYQLAIAEGLLPQGDQAGGGRLVYLGKTGAAGPTERDQDPLTADGRERVARPRAAGRGRDAGARSSWPASTTAARTARCARCAPPRPRSGGRVVTARYSPAELADALGLFAPTDEQAAVIAAPPGPLVVIAGAGAGKTETMAARVVWLVANGYATPGRGARADVHPQGGRSAAAPGPDPAGPARGRGARPRRPRRGRRAPATVGTYHAFAGTLLREHGLLLPVEPVDPADRRNRVVAVGLSRGVRASRRTRHREDARRRHRDGAAAGRPAGRAPRRHRPAARHPRRAGAAGAHAARRSAAARHAGPASGCCEMLATQTERTELVPLIDALHQRMRAENVMDFGMQMAAAARLASTFPQVGDAAAAALPGRAARRVPGHRSRAAGRAVVVVRRRRRRRPGADRGRRPDPVDLRLARCVGDQPAAVHHRLLACPTAPRRRRWSCAPAGATRRAPCIWPTRCRRRRGAGRWRCASCCRGPARSPAPSGARCCPTSRPNATGWPTTSREVYHGARDAGDAVPTAAVLVRRNADAAPMADALTARGVPVEVVGLAGLLAVPEVADVVAMLRLAADPTAGAAAMRVLTGPRWRLGAADIAALWRRAVELDCAGGAARPRRRRTQIVAVGRARRRHRLPGRRDLRSRAPRTATRRRATAGSSRSAAS